MLQLTGKKIAVTGASSMIGRAVMSKLTKRGAFPRAIPHSIYDLLKLGDAYKAVIGNDYCVHCAGYNGNISFNQKYPADIYHRTATMGLNVLHACHKFGIKKVVSPLASCAYPDEDILYEGSLCSGSPNHTVEAHGLSKRVIFDYSRQLFKQFKYMSVCLVFNTCYGPHDSFNVDKTKVVGGLISKFVIAKAQNLPSVECWGSGQVRREFIYVDDAAEAIIQTLEHYDNPNIPLNVGTGTDIYVEDLAKIIKKIVGYEGDILWNTDKPDGQFQKLLYIRRMKDYLDIEFTPLEDGLTKTIEWYKNEQVQVEV